MPHLIVEIARSVLEREMLSVPIEFDANGAPADILAPPLPLQDSSNTPIGVIRYLLIVRTVILQAVPGTAQAVVAMTFDESSIEVLSAGKSIGLLSGNMSASASIVVRQGALPNGRMIARFGVDMSNSTVAFAFDPGSHARLAAAVGEATASLIENLIGTVLTNRFRKIGFKAFGLDLGLTPGIASEDLLTAETLPGVVWVDTQTLALAVSYAPEGFPAPFGPVPFLPGGPTAFGLRLSNDGFQRTVRNPAVRKVARDMLSDRLIDGFVHDAFAARGGGGDITDADRADGAKRLDDYLKTPPGLNDLANETPWPVGGGKLRKRITGVPDPFSDFDVEVPELDLWLGTGRVEGRALARGSVNGFGFEARISFRATPVLLKEDNLKIELHDLEIDRPDIDISLPIWLEFAAAILTGVISGVLVGALVGLLLSSVVSSLVEAFIPSNLGSKVTPPDAKSLGTLPHGVSIQRLDVTPEFLALVGSWFVGLDDPRPFYPRAVLVDSIDRHPVGRPSQGEASFLCLGSLGIVMSAKQGTGATFTYVRQAWRSSVTVTLQTDSIPLPLTRFAWKLEIGYLTPQHSAALSDPAMIVTPGALPITATVWLPEPPLQGHTERRSFTIDVRQTGDATFVFDVPAEAGCILMELSTRVIDALGATWDVLHQVTVPNETVTFGSDFHDFTTTCAKHRRVFERGTVPSLLDQLWNPPEVLVEQVYDAIRTEQPAVGREIDRVFLSHGIKGLQLLLAPSLGQKLFQ